MRYLTCTERNVFIIYIGKNVVLHLLFCHVVARNKNFRIQIFFFTRLFDYLKNYLYTDFFFFKTHYKINSTTIFFQFMKEIKFS